MVQSLGLEVEPTSSTTAMVLSIPDTGLHLESSAKSADTLPLQAFALTLSDNVIEDLIQQVQNGGDVKLSLGNVPVSACAACRDVEAGNLGWEAFLLFDCENNSLAIWSSAETMCIQLGEAAPSAHLVPVNIQSGTISPLTSSLTCSPFSAAGKQSTRSPGLPRYPTWTST